MPSVKQELFQVKRTAVATAASIGTSPFDHSSILVGLAMISCPVNLLINRGGNPDAQPHPPLGQPPLRSLEDFLDSRRTAAAQHILLPSPVNRFASL